MPTTVVGAPLAVNYTPATRFGALAMDALAPWLTLHLAWYLDAIGAIVDPLLNIVSDVGEDDGTQPTVGTYDANGHLVTQGYAPGYGMLVDPTRATDLAFLGQFVGVPVPVGTGQVVARSLVIAEGGLNRGTDTAVLAAAKRNLSGTQSVVLLPRTYVDGTASAAHFVLVVRPEEVIDAAQLTADVNAVKLSGLLWALVQTDGWTISEMEADYVSLTALEAAFPTLTNLEADL